MTLFLSHRNKNLTEWMDRPDCDPELLENTYRQFTTINKLLSGWNGIYKDFIKPVLNDKQGKCSILDIGCGGGDIIRFLHELALKDGFDVEFMGIDPDNRSIEYLSSLDWPDSVQFRAVSSEILAKENRQFDIVISNHLVHHLSKQELKSVCMDSQKLSKSLILFNDIERSLIGYLSFSLFAPLLFQNSYIVRDGKISIKRSYRKAELKQVLPNGWKVKRKFPFRLFAVYKNLM